MKSEQHCQPVQAVLLFLCIEKTCGAPYGMIPKQCAGIAKRQRTQPKTGSTSRDRAVCVFAFTLHTLSLRDSSGIVRQSRLAVVYAVFQKNAPRGARAGILLKARSCLSIPSVEDTLLFAASVQLHCLICKAQQTKQEARIAPPVKDSWE